MPSNYRISFTDKEIEEGIKFLLEHTNNPLARKLLNKFQVYKKKVEVGLLRPHYELKPRLTVLEQISGAEASISLTLQEKKEKVFAEWKANPFARIWTERELDWIEQIKDPEGYAIREETKSLKKLSGQ